MESPIIIIGMHRSGTSLLSRLLEASGVFMGRGKDVNNESWFFYKSNQFMLSHAGARWDFPEPMRFTNQVYEDHMQRVMKKRLSCLYTLKEYTGWKNAIKWSSANKIPIHWGWKDPANTFTLPIWKKIFPNAKIIHISRHPLDVAVSLSKREENGRGEFNLNWKNQIKEYLLFKNYFYQRSYRLLDFEQGIKLWKLYVTQYLKLSQQYSEDIYSLRYEDLLQNPEEKLKNIMTFLKVDRFPGDSILSQINPEKAFAFNLKTQDYELDQEGHDLMERLGYVLDEKGRPLA
jgi:hypothetical protein